MNVRKMKLRSTAVAMTSRQSNVKLSNQLFHLSVMSLMCYITRTILIHQCLNRAGQNGSFKENRWRV